MTDVHGATTVETTEPRWKLLVPLAAVILGVCMRFHVMVFSGLASMPRGLVGDGRSIAFRLEHDWRWLTGRPGYESFWDVPLFYPQPHVAAYTDVMFAAGPLYWPWRALGIAPDTSFQLFVIGAAVLNFALGYWLLRRFIRVGVLAATFGAFLLSFNTSMVTYLHPQLAPLFWVLLAVIALFQIGERAEDTDARRHMALWFGVLAAAIVGQLYTAVYPFFFFGLLGIFALVVAVMRSRTRATLTTVVRRHWPVVLLSVALCVAGIAHFLYQFSLADRATDARQFRALSVLPVTHWFLPPNAGAFTGWVHDYVGTARPGQKAAMHAGGPGLVAAIVVGIGLFRRRRETAVQILMAASLGLLVISGSVGKFSVWAYVSAWVPGAEGIRAVARSASVLGLLIAIGGAAGAQALIDYRRWLLAGALVCLGVAEQTPIQRRGIDKLELRGHVRSLAARVEPGTEAFFLVSTEPRADGIDRHAAWIALETGVPTVNGRYGNSPPGWLLKSHGRGVREPWHERQVRLRGALRDWCELKGVDVDRVQWIECSPPFPWSGVKRRGGRSRPRR